MKLNFENFFDATIAHAKGVFPNIGPDETMDVAANGKDFLDRLSDVGIEDTNFVVGAMLESGEICVDIIKEQGDALDEWAAAIGNVIDKKDEIKMGLGNNINSEIKKNADITTIGIVTLAIGLSALILIAKAPEIKDGFVNMLPKKKNKEAAVIQPNRHKEA